MNKNPKSTIKKEKKKSQGERARQHGNSKTNRKQKEDELMFKNASKYEKRKTNTKNP